MGCFSFRYVLNIRLSLHLIVHGLLFWIWCEPMVGQVLAEESVYAAEVEYEVKAAFVHNFTQFIDWPSDAFETEDSSLQIGILGAGPIDNPLMNLNGKKVKGRVLEISKVEDLSEIIQYHIIFVNPSEIGQLRSVLDTLKNTGILTIGDMPGFAEECGAINFYLQGGKVRFEVNVEVAHREKLKISSKLLRLARIVNSKCD